MSLGDKQPRDGEASKLVSKKRKRSDRKVEDFRSKGNAVRSDELTWKEVELPDRLEDAEGFFGLEEIDDVEVVKDVSGRSFMFIPSTKTTTQSQAPVAAVTNPEDEWMGFEDSRDQASSQAPPAIKGHTTGALTTESRRKAVPKGPELRDDLNFEFLEDTAEPESEIDMLAWATLRLPQPVLAAIAGLGFTKPTPIQEAAIPLIREGHDVIGKAVTGSGKTLAFGIPLLEYWLDTRSARDMNVDATNSTPIALILAPTRELAHQLNTHLRDLCEPLPNRPRIVTVTGGLSVLKQQRQLDKADIIIGTPGRLWEVISDSHGLVARLKRIQFLVVDEADRLLSEGHFKEVEEILDTLDREVIEEDAGGGGKESETAQRQTLVFSATFYKELQQKLTGKSKPGGGDLLSNQHSMEYLLKKLAFREARPQFVDSNPTSQMASTLQENIVECAAMEKDIYLYGLIMQHPRAKILVFANSISSVRRLVPLLQNLDQPAVALHSTMPQKARLRSLERFSSQRTILVATDVAARGLDIKGIDLIIHYHVPRSADMYVHRSGRTARAETSGKSVLLCSPDEVAGVTRLISKIHATTAPEVTQIDRQLLSRLQPRMKLSKKITDATMAKEKTGSQDGWLRAAAEELGMDYDSEEFATEGAKNSRGRGGGKRKKQKENSVISKAQIAGMRAQLKDLLGKKVNLGISERYLAGGSVDVDAILAADGDELFLAPSSARA